MRTSWQKRRAHVLAVGGLASALIVALCLSAMAADQDQSKSVEASTVSPAEVETGGFVIEKVDNPQFRSNEIFTAYEKYESPRVWRLRERYRLDEVVASETDEFKRQLLLRHWIKQRIVINNEHPVPTRGDAFAILDVALKGGGFHCGHYMVVQHAVMNSYGYPCRSLGVDQGDKDENAHHGVNEIWSNVFAKWYISDAKYDCHFEKDGVPLSALDLRDEYQRNKGADVLKVRGPDRTVVPVIAEEKEAQAATYNWCSWLLNGNYFTNFPASGSSANVMYEDDFYRANTWYRGKQPHWAYKADFVIPIRHRGWIEWTPNVVSVSVEIKPGPSNTDEPGYWAHCTARSWTPNFKEYQLKVGDGEWYPVEERFEVPLYQDANEFRVRSVNLFEVTGPEHLIRISR